MLVLLLFVYPNRTEYLTSKSGLSVTTFGYVTSKSGCLLPNLTLLGLCAKHLNKAIDFAIANNKLCVKFKDRRDKLHNMVHAFAITVWVCYCKSMVTSPALTSKACQKVLHYLLQKPSNLVTAWRKRLYFYGSGTILIHAASELLGWIDEQPDVRREYVRKLLDKEGFFNRLGNAIVTFVEAKRQPFPWAMKSKRHFMEYDNWKRAMIFVFMSRYLLGWTMNKKWFQWTDVQYKRSVRSFKRYLTHDHTIITTCDRYIHDIPDVSTVTSPETRKKRKRGFCSTTNESEDTEAVTIFKVGDDTTSEDSDIENE